MKRRLTPRFRLQVLCFLIHIGCVFLALDSFGGASLNAPARVGNTPKPVFGLAALGGDKDISAPAVFFTDANTGIATAGIGRIFRTIDGGRTWIAQPSGTRSHLTTITFSNALSGRLIGEDGTILRTTDGGLTWRALSSGRAETRVASQSNPTELWASQYDGPSHGPDDPRGVAVSPDGTRVFVTGSSEGIGTFDDWATVAYDRVSGKQLWVARYNGPANSYEAPQAPPVVSPDSSRIYVTGNMSLGDGTKTAMRTIAYNASDGSELWAVSYQGPADRNDSPRALAVSPDGSRLFVTGWSEYPDPVFRKYASIAYNTKDGTQLWATEYHGPGTGGDPYAMAVSPDGSRVFVTGGSIGSDNDVDFGTVAYDANDGTELWVARYNGSGNSQDQGQAIAVSADGSRVFVTGESTSGPSPSLFDYATIAYDTADGSELWVKLYNGPGNDEDWAKKLTVVGKQVFVTGASTGLDPQQQDFATVAYNAIDGSQEWVARYVGADPASPWYSVPVAIGLSVDGAQLFVMGSSPDIGTNLDWVMAAYRTSNGEELWIARHDGSSHSSDSASGLALYGHELYLTGSLGAASGLFNDYGTVAYHYSDPTPAPTASPTPGSTPTPVPTPTPAQTASPGLLVNISTRLRVETGNNILIGGFIVSGTQPKKIIVRAIGPSLSSSFPDALADPVLELRGSEGALIRSNDNWRSDQEAEIIKSGIPPSNDLESAIVATLPANNSAYTAIVRGANSGTGIALVEVYDLGLTADSKFANISTRGFVDAGDNVLIGGLIVIGQDPLRVLLRAIGPSLDVEGALTDPTLELRDDNGALITSNDNWRSDHEAEIKETAIPPTNDLESAILQSLAPGSYTAIVRGMNGATGLAVVEAYSLNNGTSSIVRQIPR